MLSNQSWQVATIEQRMFVERLTPVTLRKFNIAPEKIPSQYESSLPTSNHHLSGAMLNFGRVVSFFLSFFLSYAACSSRRNHSGRVVGRTTPWAILWRERSHLPSQTSRHFWGTMMFPQLPKVGPMFPGSLEGTLNVRPFFAPRRRLAQCHPQAMVVRTETGRMCCFRIWEFASKSWEYLFFLPKDQKILREKETTPTLGCVGFCSKRHHWSLKHIRSYSLILFCGS